jgi:hypothetical protein
MSSKKIAIITFLVSFFCSTAAGQDTVPEPMYTHLEAGEAAPFAGTLFNPTALSQMLVDSQYSFDECDLRIEFEKNLLSADYELRLNILQASYDSLSEQHNLLMSIKDEEIETYRTMALERPNKNNHWWLVGGVASGVVLTLASAWALGQVSSVSSN